jgi:D-alanyl-D-alanine carboxypeptidase
MKKYRLSILFVLLFVTIVYPQIKKTTPPPPIKFKNNSQLPELTKPQKQINRFGIIKNFNEFDSTLAFQFQYVLDSLLVANNIVGASVAINMPAKGTWLGVSGTSNPATGDSIKPDMLFDIGSNTKTFIAALVLKLVDEGLVNLDDQINQWLPEFPNIDGDVTIRQLLNHTSGISDYLNENPAAVETLFVDLDRFWAPEYSLSYVLEPNFTKGTDWSYSNTGYLLSGMIIKQVTGSEKVSTVLRDRILDPLNLNATFLDIDENLMGELSHGWMYYSETDEWFDSYELPRTAIYSCMYTAGAIVSTAENMVRWIRELYTGQVLSQETLNQMLTIVPFNNDVINGYGLGTMKRVWLGEQAWAHGGDTFSFGSQAAYFPEKDVSIVVLVNQRNYPYQDFYDMITEQLLQEVLNYYIYPHDLTHLYDLKTISQFVRPNVDTLKITTQLNNPDNHNVQVVASVVSLDSTFVDSTIFADDGKHFDGEANDGLLGGFLTPLSSENEFLISARYKDFDTNEDGIFHKTARFTTVGPLAIDSYAILSGDTLVNPGETIPIQITLRNKGKNATALNVQTKLTCLSSDQVQIVGKTNFGDIAAGEARLAVGANAFILPEDFQDNTEIVFRVDILSRNHVYWSDTLRFYVYPTAVKTDDNRSIPLEYALNQNYPNPFNSSTVISYRLPVNSFVDLTVYSITGQKISTIVSGQQQAGVHRYDWDGIDFASGVYIVRLATQTSNGTSPNYTQTKKLILMK